MSQTENLPAVEATPVHAPVDTGREGTLQDWGGKLLALHARLKAAGFTVQTNGGLRRDEPGGSGSLPPELLWRCLAAIDHLRQRLKPGSRLLCAGEAVPLLALALGEAGFETHAVLDDSGGAGAGTQAARALDVSQSVFHHMTPDRLEFSTGHFHLACSAGFLEHLDYPLKQQALAELARCLRKKGLLSISFRHGESESFIRGIGKDARLRNRLATPEDAVRAFLETGRYEVKRALSIHDPVAEVARLLPAVAIGPTPTATSRMGTLLLRAQETSASASSATVAEAPWAATDCELTEPLQLSVIICTYRRPELLRQALASLLEQSLPPSRFEVIVIDNNSHDETESVVREVAARTENVRYVHESKQGLSHSRNRGAVEARGDYLVYLDDDARAHREYLLNAYRTIVQLRPDILGGPIFPYYTTPRPAWFKDEYEIRRHAKQTGWSTHCSVSGSSFIIRRDLLGELGGFDPSLGMVGDTVRLGEEKAVLKRYRLRPLAEQKVYYDLSCIVYHHVPAEKMTSGYLLKRYYVAGHAKARIERLTRGPWSTLDRLRYVLGCCKGRFLGLVEELRQLSPRQRLKQLVLERATGVMFEVGRVVGCFVPGRTMKTDDPERLES